MKRVLAKIRNVLASRRFFVFVLIFFVIESAWVALSANYPQAFDEDFHFGLIQLYSHHWLPFLGSQPPHADMFGAVARDPSYLYHYLMSFPYRFISLFVHTQTPQVIILRFINIGFFAGGLILLRRILLRVGTSRILTNVSMFLFILIPIVPQLAGQINYDNLFIPLVAGVVLLTFKAIEQLKSQKPTALLFITLLSVCLLTSLVKYAFLPIFLAVVVFLVYIAARSYHKNLRKFFNQLYSSFKKASLGIKIGLVALLIVSLGMFIQRDGVNLVKYHNFAPNCSSVLTIKQCSNYSVWYTDYTRHLQVGPLIKNGSFKYSNQIAYLFQWIYWMWYRLFFAVNGPVSSYANYPPLPLPASAGIIVILLALYSIVKWRKKVFKNDSYLIFLVVASIFYIIALMIQGYSTYRYTGILENMNGRYLLPIILLLVAIVARAISIEFKHATMAKTLVSLFVVILFLEGGGVITFITRSNDTWYFQNSAVKKINNETKKIINPAIVNGNTQYNTSVWFFN